MEGRNINVARQTSEIFAHVRGEITETKGDVSLFLASGEEVPAVKGTKLYLNDMIVSREDGAILASFNDVGVLVLGQNQQMHLHSDLFHRINLLDQAATPASRTQLKSGIEITALALAIQAGQNVEELLDPDALLNGDVATSKVILYQRVGNTLLPISSFETSIFSRTQMNLINEFGDIDINSEANDIFLPLI
jgi:hypothetical protein